MKNLTDIAKGIRMGDYDYCLPERAIAQFPVEKRDTSRLIILRGEKAEEDTFINIDNYIPSDSLLVFNNTRVIRARILFQKDSGPVIEIFCIEPLKPSDYQLSFASESGVEWKCIVGNLRRWKSGNISKKIILNGIESTITAEKTGPPGETMNIKFSWEPPHLTFGEVIEKAGRTPLPPYIKRDDNHNDALRYQTLISKYNGSVAAPTAGLHFSESLLGKIRDKGITISEVTLHIGAGTFKPVKTNSITEHSMHTEHFMVCRKTIEMIPAYYNRIVAVGTTSVRTLETLYWLGVKTLLRGNPDYDEMLSLDQWEEYTLDDKITVIESFEALLGIMDRKKLDYLHAKTSIMIVPGYDFRIVNGLITNFHQPRSTLLLLVAAFIGPGWRDVYNYALNKNFRFLSYGDSSLFFR